MNDSHSGTLASPGEAAAGFPSAAPPARVAQPAGGLPYGGPLLGTLPYRPNFRRPMALVHVIDDGREAGEIVRMRSDRLVIGRAAGDIVVPHDICMSPTHAAIERLEEGGWLLRDLGSVAGTFVRVTSARLVTGTVIQVGRTQLRFEETGPTSGWLVERAAGGPVRRHECRAPVATIGRSEIALEIGLSDPFVSPIHATIRRTPRGWRITNAGWNGLWVRIAQPVRMAAASQFLCGEQRFVFEPLG
jgi:pSer/pThr/pTyr-binding forkhead associated (FHA) protein